MADPLPLIAVVIPALNEERFLPRCLAALCEVDYPAGRYFVQVVDNYSTDHTPAIAQSLGARLIQAEKRTIAFSRNIGALSTDADLIAFLDADCIADRQWLRRAARNFTSLEVVAAGSYPSVLSTESNALQRAWAALCRKEDLGIHPVDWLPSANLVVRASRFKEIGGFNEALATCEDVDLGYRLSANGLVLCDPEMIVHHLREPESFKAFFRKEVWHAKFNIAGSLSHGLRLSELPSLVAPLAFGSALFAVLIGAFWSTAVFASGLLIVGLVPSVYALGGLKRCRNLPLALTIYFVYFSARAYASFRELARLLLRQSRHASTRTRPG